MRAQKAVERGFFLEFLGKVIFSSRWLQMPLYLGLIIAQCVYVYQFMVELIHLVHNSLSINEVEIMLVVLGLIDVVMIANLLVMVVMGGYETFVSRLYTENHPDHPEWLSHVDASTMKIKLSMALIGISSIHLLKTFINASQIDTKTIIAQVGIHFTFVLSAVAMAYIAQLMPKHEIHQELAGKKIKGND
jgi:uncharacterized protein (TIGR00645 family)